MQLLRKLKKAVDFLKETDVNEYISNTAQPLTPLLRGNIGVVADFLLEYLAQPFTILCPSLPVNQRIVKDGNLYVNGEN